MTRPGDDFNLSGLADVPRETQARLSIFVSLLARWQKATNLIAPATVPDLWTRHVADSAQLAMLFPAALRWVDLGSGGGFPGLVTAILNAGRPGARVDLIESDQRKSAFLRQVIRETGAPATVHTGRIESVLDGWREPVEMISARALAPLDRLLSLSEPLFRLGGRAAFHKGQDFEREIEEASKSWDFDLVTYRSTVGRSGVILEIGGLARKGGVERVGGPS